MSGPYDPEWTAFEKSMGDLPPLPAGIEERVKFFDGMLVQMQQLLPPTDPGIQTRDEQVTPDIKVRIYTPPTRTTVPLPLLLFIHGGGYHAGNLDTEDHLCRYLCSNTPMIVVSVDYRMVLKDKFPTPIDDCYDAYRWAVQSASTLGADPARFVVSGGSAGAGLAIAVVYRLVQKGEKVAGLLPVQPMSLHPDFVLEKYKPHHKSYVENGGKTPVVDAEATMRAFELIGGRSVYGNGEWFPQTLGAEAFKGFPPTWIFNTNLECFRDDGGVLELQLTDAGARVKREVMEGWPHYFWCFPVVEGGKAFREKFVKGIRWVLDSSH